MIDFSKYNLSKEDIEFITQTEDWCINGQSEITLEYKGNSFVLEPHGKAVQVVVPVDTIVGNYESFEDLLLGHKIGGKPLIELIKDIEYGE